MSAFGQKTFGNEKNYQPVSRILFPRERGWSSFIWSLHYCRGSSCLPSGIGRAALNRRYTWHFSMQGLPAPAVTCRSRGLLPHVFNLTSCEAVIFCGTICGRVNAPRLLTGTLPCAVRTFLPLYEQRAMTRLVVVRRYED